MFLSRLFSSLLAPLTPLLQTVGDTADGLVRQVGATTISILETTRSVVQNLGQSLSKLSSRSNPELAELRVLGESAADGVISLDEQNGTIRLEFEMDGLAPGAEVTGEFSYLVGDGVYVTTEIVQNGNILSAEIPASQLPHDTIGGTLEVLVTDPNGNVTELRETVQTDIAVESLQPSNPVLESLEVTGEAAADGVITPDERGGTITLNFELRGINDNLRADAYYVYTDRAGESRSISIGGARNPLSVTLDLADLPDGPMEGQLSLWLPYEDYIEETLIDIRPDIVVQPLPADTPPAAGPGAGDAASLPDQADPEWEAMLSALTGAKEADLGDNAGPIFLSDAPIFTPAFSYGFASGLAQDAALTA